jgi:hypothetical protein
MSESTGGIISECPGGFIGIGILIHGIVRGLLEFVALAANLRNQLGFS